MAFFSWFIYMCFHLFIHLFISCSFIHSFNELCFITIYFKCSLVNQLRNEKNSFYEINIDFKGRLLISETWPDEHSSRIQVATFIIWRSTLSHWSLMTEYLHFRSFTTQYINPSIFHFLKKKEKQICKTLKLHSIDLIIFLGLIKKHI